MLQRSKHPGGSAEETCLNEDIRACTAHGLSTGNSHGSRVGVSAAELVEEMHRLNVDYVLLAGYLKVRVFVVSPLRSGVVHTTRPPHEPHASASIRHRMHGG